MVERPSWTRLTARSITRRRLLSSAATGGALLAGSTILACGGRNSSSNASSGRSNQSRAANEPKRGGVIAHAGGKAGSYDTQGTTLDPHINSPLGARGFRLMYQGLLAYDLGN